MNLGTRKLLEITFLALIDSGINYRGRNIGCYMSAVAHDMFSVSGHVGHIVLHCWIIVDIHRDRTTRKPEVPFLVVLQ